MAHSRHLLAFTLCLVTVAFLTIGRPASAQPPSAAETLASVLTADTLVVGYLDLERLEEQLSADAVAAFIANVAPTLSEADREQVRNRAEPIYELLAALREAGAGRVYMAMGLSDAVMNRGPVAVLPVGWDGQPEEAVRAAQNAWRAISEVNTFRRAAAAESSGAVRAEWREESRTVIVGSQTALEHLRTAQIVERPDLTEALGQLAENQTAAIAVSPGPDQRRVIRELWPALPPPAAGLTGPFLADQVEWLGLRAQGGEQSQVQITVSTSDANAAVALRGMADPLLRLASQSIVRMQQMAPQQRALASQLLTLVDPQTEGNRLSLTLRADDATAGLLTTAAQDALRSAQATAMQHQRMNQLRSLMLALFTYEDAYGHFPAAAAVRDEAGRPLLSWRVAVLPFLNARDLYNQFHLDEPWDSPHNSELVARMPEIFADPAAQALAREGKTLYQLPVHAESLFPPAEGLPLVERDGRTFAEGTRIRDTTDGLSNTIAIVPVAPAHAVEWTRPADWEVDLADPLALLRYEGRENFSAAFSDGHTKTMPMSIDPARLRALITRAGEELIEW